MSVVSVKRKPPDADPHASEIERLEHEREALSSELGRLRKIEDGAAALERRIAALDAELAELGVAERAAVEKWAASGAHEDPPSPDVAKRRGLEQSRALAEADRSAATSRRDATRGRVAAIAADIANISLEIRRIRIDRAMERVRGIAAEVDTLAEELRAKWQDIIAAGKALSEAAASGSSADARAHSLLIGALQELDALAAPDLSWRLAEVDALVPPWRAAFA